MVLLNPPVQLGLTPLVIQNRANSDLQRSHMDGSGYHYWVDADSRFMGQDQSGLTQFRLSLDDDPRVWLEANR